MRKFLLLFLVLPLLSMETLRLPNGLQVIIIKRNIPSIFLTVFYRAGSSWEPEGKWGLAYMSSLLSFWGSGKRNPWEQIFFLEKVGGGMNIELDRDFAIFKSYFPKEEFPLALWYEHERMKSLHISHINFLKEERRASQEVINSRKDQDFVIENILLSQAFANSMYAHNPMGTPETISSLDLKDVISYHRRYFQPYTSTIVLVGDIGKKEKDLVVKMFSPVPSQKVIFPEKIEFQSREINKKMLLKGIRTPIYGICYRLSSPSCVKRYSLEMAGIYLKRKLEEFRLRMGYADKINIKLRHFLFSSTLCVIVKGKNIRKWEKEINKIFTNLRVNSLSKTDLTGLKLSFIRDLREKEINPSVWGEITGRYSLIFKCSEEDILAGVSLMTPQGFWEIMRRSFYPFNRVKVLFLPWKEQ